jgi:hypothetical protein
MKSACHAAALGAILGGGLLAGRADDSKTVPLAPAAPFSMAEAPHFGSPAPVDPSTATSLQDDPEGAVAQAASLREEYLQQQAALSADAAAKQQAYDNDWMLRGYTAELKNEGIGTTADRNAAASLEAPDPNAPPKTDWLAPSPADTNSSSTRRSTEDSNNSSTASASNSPAPFFLPPLLPPAGGPNSAKPVTRLDAWGSTTTMEMVPPPSLNSALSFSGKDRGTSQDSNSETSLEVPGLTAERQGLGDMNDASVPDQQLEAITENADNRAHRDFLLPVASNDSTEFFKRQSEVLTAPNAMIHPPVAGNILLGPPPAPPLAVKTMPVPTGIRSHVDDPFDLIGGHRY